MFTTTDFSEVNRLADHIVNLNQRTCSARHQLSTYRNALSWCSKTDIFPLFLLPQMLTDFSEEMALRSRKVVNPKSTAVEGSSRKLSPFPQFCATTLLLSHNSKWTEPNLWSMRWMWRRGEHRALMPAVQSAGATVTCNLAQVQTKAEIRHVRRPQAISPCCLHFINKAISMVPWCRLGQLQGNARGLSG